MTTFTTDDREDEYKKILAAAPNQPGYEDAVPIYSPEDIKAIETGLDFYEQLREAGASKHKDLTDAEIYEVFKGCVFEGGFCKYEFARAILKKAGEK